MAQRRRNENQEKEWDFFSFAPLFAFTCGAFLATMLLFLSQGLLFLPIWVLSMFGASFGLAHIISHQLRKRTLDRRVQAEEEEERERRALAARAAARGEAAAPGAVVRRRRRRR
jgi:hypothetical protein